MSQSVLDSERYQLIDRNKELMQRFYMLPVRVNTSHGHFFWRYGTSAHRSTSLADVIATLKQEIKRQFLSWYQ
jgi:hypothetical protein